MKVEFISVENLRTMQPESTTNTRPMRSCKTPLSSAETTPKIQPKTTTGSKQKTGTKAKQQRINCDTCKLSFPTKKSYELHNKNYHSGKKGDVCDQSLDDTDNRLNRARRQDGKAEESERYQCNICQTCFADFNDLDSHVRQHFNLDIRYKCNSRHCEKSFRSISNR